MTAKRLIRILRAAEPNAEVMIMIRGDSTAPMAWKYVEDVIIRDKRVMYPKKPSDLLQTDPAIVTICGRGNVIQLDLPETPQ